MVRDVDPFVQIDNLPPWLDGQVIRALAKKNYWTYDQAKSSLEALGHMPTVDLLKLILEPIFEADFQPGSKPGDTEDEDNAPD